MFVHWIYTGRVPKDDDKWGLMSKPCSTKDMIYELLYACIKAYIFADGFLTPDFGCLVNDRAVEAMSEDDFANAHARVIFCHAFANIPANRVTLQAIVEHYVSVGDIEAFSLTALSKLPCEMRRRVLLRFREFRTTKEHKKVNMREKAERCYLEHSTDEEKEYCYKSHMRYDTDEDLGVFE